MEVSELKNLTKSSRDDIKERDRGKNQWSRRQNNRNDPSWIIENRLEKKINWASGTCGIIIRDLTFMSLESQKER